MKSKSVMYQFDAHRTSKDNFIPLSLECYLKTDKSVLILIWSFEQIFSHLLNYSFIL